MTKTATATAKTTKKNTGAERITAYSLDSLANEKKLHDNVRLATGELKLKVSFSIPGKENDIKTITSEAFPREYFQSSSSTVYNKYPWFNGVVKYDYKKLKKYKYGDLIKIFFVKNNFVVKVLLPSQGAAVAPATHSNGLSKNTLNNLEVMMVLLFPTKEPITYVSGEKYTYLTEQHNKNQHDKSASARLYIENEVYTVHSISFMNDMIRNEFYVKFYQTVHKLMNIEMYMSKLQRAKTSKLIKWIFRNFPIFNSSSSLTHDETIKNTYGLVIDPNTTDANEKIKNNFLDIYLNNNNLENIHQLYDEYNSLTYHMMYAKKEIIARIAATTVRGAGSEHAKYSTLLSRVDSRQTVVCNSIKKFLFLSSTAPPSILDETKLKNIIRNNFPQINIAIHDISTLFKNAANNTGSNENITLRKVAFKGYGDRLKEFDQLFKDNDQYTILYERVTDSLKRDVTSVGNVTQFLRDIELSIDITQIKDISGNDKLRNAISKKLHDEMDEYDDDDDNNQELSRKRRTENEELIILVQLLHEYNQYTLQNDKSLSQMLMNYYYNNFSTVKPTKDTQMPTLDEIIIDKNVPNYMVCFSSSDSTKIVTNSFLCFMNIDLIKGALDSKFLGNYECSITKTKLIVSGEELFDKYAKMFSFTSDQNTLDETGKHKQKRRFYKDLSKQQSQQSQPQSQSQSQPQSQEKLSSSSARNTTMKKKVKNAVGA